MVMVFTLVSAVQEKLSCLVDEAKKRKTEEEERKIREQEEAEHVSQSTTNLSQTRTSLDICPV